MLAYICNHTMTWHDDMVHFYLHANKTFAITLFYYANFQQIICSFYDQCYSFYYKLTWNFCTLMNYSRIICKSYDIWHGLSYIRYKNEGFFNDHKVVVEWGLSIFLWPVITIYFNLRTYFTFYGTYEILR